MPLAAPGGLKIQTGVQKTMRLSGTILKPATSGLCITQSPPQRCPEAKVQARRAACLFWKIHLYILKGIRMHLAAPRVLNKCVGVLMVADGSVLKSATAGYTAKALCSRDRMSKSTRIKPHARVTPSNLQSNRLQLNKPHSSNGTG